MEVVWDGIGVDRGVSKDSLKVYRYTTFITSMLISYVSPK